VCHSCHFFSHEFINNGLSIVKMNNAFSLSESPSIWRADQN
jgi:hypothetical protein